MQNDETPRKTFLDRMRAPLLWAGGLGLASLLPITVYYNSSYKVIKDATAQVIADNQKLGSAENIEGVIHTYMLAYDSAKNEDVAVKLGKTADALTREDKHRYAVGQVTEAIQTGKLALPPSFTEESIGVLLKNFVKEYNIKEAVVQARLRNMPL